MTIVQVLFILCVCVCVITVLCKWFLYYRPFRYSNYVTTNTVFIFLNVMDFKFVSHGLRSEEQNIMHKKEFWILTNKCENKLKQENEWPCPLMFKLTSTCSSQNPKLFFMHVLKKDVLLQ